MSAVANRDRARSKLQLMTYSQLLKVAEKHGVEFDFGSRRKLGRKQMAAQLADIDSVVDEYGRSDG